MLLPCPCVQQNKALLTSVAAKFFKCPYLSSLRCQEGWQRSLGCYHVLRRYATQLARLVTFIPTVTLGDCQLQLPEEETGSIRAR